MTSGWCHVIALSFPVVHILMTIHDDDDDDDDADDNDDDDDDELHTGR